MYIEKCALVTFGLRTWFESRQRPCKNWRIMVDYVMF